jgi:hypothetical protein
MKVEGVSWAVLLYVLDGTFPTSDASKLHVGDNVRVVLNPSKDGNHRALLVQPDKNDPFSAVVIH